MASWLPHLLDWGNLLLRWLHVIVAIAWIGSSFYFVWLDNSITPPEEVDLREKGVMGELWAVHGGGFYNPQKYLLAPKKLPAHLHWFFWESYSTWLSGFALFTVLYLFNAQAFLVDAKVLPMSSLTAVLAALAFGVVGWLVYDALCRVFWQRKNAGLILGLSISLFVVFATWLACQIFAGRAAFLITGAMLATCMSANVFFWIIPGQRKMVASMQRGETPEAIHGQRAKLRSVHNTYFTLPVLIAMLSNHYAMLYSHPQNWAILLLLMFAGVFIRQFFVVKHKGHYQWAYPALAMLLLIVAAVWTAPAQDTAQTQNVSTAQVQTMIAERCVMCHNATLASKNIRLDSAEAIETHAQAIYQQVVLQKTMPLNNATGMTDSERALVSQWFHQRAK